MNEEERIKKFNELVEQFKHTNPTLEFQYTHKHHAVYLNTTLELEIYVILDYRSEVSRDMSFTNLYNEADSISITYKGIEYYE